MPHIEVVVLVPLGNLFAQCKLFFFGELVEQSRTHFFCAFPMFYFPCSHAKFSTVDAGEEVAEGRHHFGRAVSECLVAGEDFSFFNQFGFVEGADACLVEGGLLH